MYLFIPLNLFVCLWRTYEEGRAKTIDMQTGSQPKGNSSSLLLPISIHQGEMPFTNPHNYAQ